jgi:peroxiredoxin Q/BCP
MMNPLQVGDHVPHFSGIDDQGNPWSSADFKDKKLVVFFYPKASTPGCTAEACSLRDHYSELLAQGYALVGVSADSVKKQAKFKDTHQFPFPLLADEERKVIELFGVWGEKKFMGRTYDGIHRYTFVVENGAVIRVFDKVNTANHASQILEA